MRTSLLALYWLAVLSISTEAWGCDWPAWNQAKQAMLTRDGRMVDASSPQKITTSEGQSYGLFFSLVANDPKTFAQILSWTENNLAKGDLQRNLPSWQWGQTSEGQWRVLDPNNASDSDLWIAYSLLEAARLWNKPQYERLGINLLWRTTAQTMRKLPGLGLMVLPGDYGFEQANGWRLNPSYLPPQLTDRFALIDPVWEEVARNTRRLLIETSPKGFAPDWVRWQSNQQWAADTQYGARGSYDAIRVYLWVGMMDSNAAQRQELVQHFAPMAQKTVQENRPPEQLDTATGSFKNHGPVGFSAALLPLLSALHQEPTLETQKARLLEAPPAADAYYNQMLLLFGEGWEQKRYRFDQEGHLQPEWGTKCRTQD